MEVFFDPVKRQKAEEYQRAKLRHNWIVRVLVVLGVCLFLSFRWEFPVYDFLTGWTDVVALQVLSYMGGLLLTGWILQTLFEYFTTYQMKRVFGISKQRPGAWLVDQVKYLVLTLIFVLLTSWGLLTFIGYFPNHWWMYGTLAVFLLGFFLSFLMPVVILPWFYQLTPYPDTPLRKKLEHLMERANVDLTEIYEINYSAKTTSANASVMGLGKTRKIVLGDTLQEHYTDGEIEAILAHEIGHHVHKDIFRLTCIGLLVFLAVAFVTARIWPQVVEWRGYGELSSTVGLPMLYVIMGTVYWLVSPLQMWYSRHRERRADAFSLNLIEHPRDLGMALVKLADDNLSRLRFDWYTLFFEASHPSPGTRIERALNWKKQK